MTATPQMTPSTPSVTVRGLTPADADAAIALDAKITGRKRDMYLRPKIDEAVSRGGIRVSLAAEADRHLVGFLLAKVWYGEFGALEPVAVLDTVGVHPDFRGQGVGAALLDQLRTNLGALGIRCLRTEVAWNDQGLLTFFAHEGFTPAARLVLETDPDSPSARERRERRQQREDEAV